MTNNHCYDNLGTFCFRGGGGSLDSSMMPNPITTATITNNIYDYSTNTADTDQAWAAVEVNKVRSLLINNNVFKNIQMPNGWTFTSSFAIQCWSMYNWGLTVTNNNFLDTEGNLYDGGVIVATQIWTKEAGNTGEVVLNMPSGNLVSNNNFNNLVYGVWAGTWKTANGDNSAAVTLNPLVDAFVASTGSIMAPNNYWGTGGAPSKIGLDSNYTNSNGMFSTNTAGISTNILISDYEWDSRTDVAISNGLLNTREKNKLLVGGGGLLSGLKFDTTGQSANIMFIGGKWRVINSGAGPVL